MLTQEQVQAAELETERIVRALSEHRMTKCPQCRFKTVRVMPSISEITRRRYATMGGQSYDGASFINIFSGERCTAKLQRPGVYGLTWKKDGRSSQTTEAELKSAFTILA